MPITAHGPDGRAWTLGRAAASHRRGPGDRAAALHHQPSARYGRQPDRRAPRSAGADAAPASAGAVRLGPHPRRHEPPPHRADYLGAIERLRAARPDIAFTSDFIVGFPGETEDDFDATLALIEAVGYAGAFSFKYSPRPGTPAAEMAEQVPDDAEVGAVAAPAAAHQRAIRPRSTHAAWAATSMSCSKSPAAILASSWAARRISSRCRSWRRRR